MRYVAPVPSNNQDFAGGSAKCQPERYEHFTPGMPRWLEDPTWYVEWQRAMVRELAGVPLLLRDDEATAPVSDAMLPIGDDSMAWVDVYRLGVNFYFVPGASIAERCSVIAENWIKLFGKVELIECILTPPNLIERVRQTASLENLGAELKLEQAETVAWLKSLIAAVAEAKRPACLDRVIPDQTPEGSFRPSSELFRDTDIDNKLKDVLEALDYPIRSQLAHKDITGAEIIIKRVQPRGELVSNAKDRLKQQMPAKYADPKFRAACLTMFQWLASEERWHDLRDAIPVYTLDEAVTVTKTPARLLAPRKLWPGAARLYWDTFPRGSVLSDDYASLLDSRLWSKAAANGVLVMNLLWLGEEKLTDLGKYTPNFDLEEGHNAAAPVQVGKLAFINSSIFYDALRGSSERAARFLEFILDYVVDVDKSWKKSVKVLCQCGKEHEIIPCEWLSFIRDRQWVPWRRGHERLNDASLARTHGA